MGRRRTVLASLPLPVPLPLPMPTLSYNAYFVDLFVRISNVLAIAMYERLGYVVYRQVERYYSGEEDAYGTWLVVLSVDHPRSCKPWHWQRLCTLDGSGVSEPLVGTPVCVLPHFVACFHLQTCEKRCPGTQKRPPWFPETP